MPTVAYEEVVKLAEQLSPTEQRALAAHLQELAARRTLTGEDRKRLFESIIVSASPGADFSLNREERI